MTKRILLFLLVIFVSLCAFAANPLIILEGSLEYEYRKTTISLTYPVILEIENKEALSKINDTIKTEVFNFYEYFKQLAAINASVVRTSLNGHVSYETTLNVPDFLSINITYYQFTGGAHGVYDVVNYTFKTSTGERLSLEDLFISESDYLNEIKDEVIRQINTSDEVYFEDALETVRDSSFNFYLTPEHFVVYYGLYEICPYSSGIPKFKIPYKMLEDYLIRQLTLSLAQ